MFTEKEIKFIKSQDWINEYINLGREQIKRDLVHCIKEKKKSQAYTQIKELGLTDTGIILFYAKILAAINEGGQLDNCSIILKENNVLSNIESIKSEITEFFTGATTEYVCTALDKAGDRFVITLQSHGEYPYEDFDVDDELWRKFEGKLAAENGYRFSVPVKYWGK